MRNRNYVGSFGHRALQRFNATCGILITVLARALTRGTEVPVSRRAER
jgi:hypothetical protein